MVGSLDYAGFEPLGKIPARLTFGSSNHEQVADVQLSEDCLSDNNKNGERGSLSAECLETSTIHIHVIDGPGKHRGFELSVTWHMSARIYAY